MSRLSCSSFSKQVHNALEKTVDRPLPHFTIHQPADFEEAAFYSKILSKLSPTVGNILEYSLTKTLASALGGDWERQDPDFPDIIYKTSDRAIRFGVEIKTWYPLATEATARFKESQSHLKNDCILLALIAWVPSHIIFGSPTIVDIFIDNSYNIAKSRDENYHNPPYNILLEPIDTSNRTRNLQQRVVTANRLQSEHLPEGVDPLKEVKSLAEKYGIENPYQYSIDSAYQEFIRRLASRLPYRSETNFGKLDRIPYGPLSSFIESTASATIRGMTISEWKLALRELTRKGEVSPLAAQAVALLGIS